MLPRRFAAFPPSLPLARAAATVAFRSAPLFATAAVTVAPGVVSALRSCASPPPTPPPTQPQSEQLAELKSENNELKNERAELQQCVDRRGKNDAKESGIRHQIVARRSSVRATLRHQVGLLEWRTDLYENVAGAQALSIDGNTKDPATGIELIKMKKSSWFALRRGDADSNLLIVREWHRAFWERYKEHLYKKRHSVAIDGTAGIGKTIALNYVLWKLLTSPPAMGDRRYVVLVQPKLQLVVVFDTMEKMAAMENGAGEDTLRDLCDTLDRDCLQSIFLHDLGVGVAEAAWPWVGGAESVVLAAAPGATAESFLKASSASLRKFKAPLFSDAEMRFVARRVWPDHKNWQDRAKKAGNVPRLVFKYSDGNFRNWVKKTEREVLGLSDDVLSRYCDKKGGYYGLSDRLVARVPSADFTFCTTVPRSDYFAQLARARRERETKV